MDSVWANREHPYWRAPRDLWHVAGAPRSPPYPCRCRHPKPCPVGCACWGRVDTELVPETCCAARAVATRQREVA